MNFFLSFQFKITIRVLKIILWLFLQKIKNYKMGLMKKNKKNIFLLILTKVDKSCKIQGEFFGWILNIVEKRMLKKLQFFSEITKSSQICSSIFRFLKFNRKNSFEWIICKIHLSQIQKCLRINNCHKTNTIY